jgi:hypothetical protein
MGKNLGKPWENHGFNVGEVNEVDPLSPTGTHQVACVEHSENDNFS